jgi:hypothetical protein
MLGVLGCRLYGNIHKRGTSLREIVQIVVGGPLSWLVLLLATVAASAGYGVLASVARRHFWWSGACIVVGKVAALLTYGTIGTNYALLLGGNPNLHPGHLTAATLAMSASLTVASLTAAAIDSTTRHAVIGWLRALRAWAEKTVASFGNGKPPVHKV